MNLNQTKLIYEQYCMLHTLALNTYTNDLFNQQDVIENFGNLTESVVINIMEYLGYINDEEFAFNTIIDGINDGNSFEYVLEVLETFKVKKAKIYNEDKPFVRNVFNNYEAIDTEEFIRALTTAMFENKGNRIDCKR